MFFVRVVCHEQGEDGLNRRLRKSTETGRILRGHHNFAGMSGHMQKAYPAELNPMPNITLNGDLSARIDQIVSSFDGAIARGGFGGLSVSAGFPWAVSLSGGSLRIPSDGFLEGTVLSMTLKEGVIEDLSSPIQFLTRLEISDLSADAEVLFDVIERTATSAIGRFNDAAFEELLNSEDWDILGGEDADLMAPSLRMNLSGNDTLRGEAGEDRIEAANGRDKLYGGLDGDTLSGGAGQDTLYGGTGNDRVKGERGADRLYGGEGKDTLFGGEKGDQIKGGKGADRLDGGRGNDTLMGDKGADVLIGGKGNDIMTGGGGADRFRFALNSNEGRDEIVDFDINRDVIQMTGTSDTPVTFGSTDRGQVIFTPGGTEIELIGVAPGSVTLDDIDFI